MDYSEIVQSSIQALTINKLRTFLATLGVVIGIGSVIALVSLGQSGQKAVANQIQALGSNLLTVMPGSISSGGVRQAAGGVTTLTYDDAIAIRDSSDIQTIQSVSAEATRRMQVTTGSANTNTSIIGTLPSYQNIRKITLSSGTFLSSRDVESMAKHAVLGSQAAEDLFPQDSTPVGNMIRINKIAFTVIGVTASKGGSGFQNQDDVIYIPLTTAQKLVFGIDYVNTISIEAVNEDAMSQAREDIGYFLLHRHRLSDPSQADFSIFSQEDVLGAASQVTGTFTALLSGIAAISLLVGGIGIMNIMLVTVTERTREIGLRKALGAKKKWIILQFLTESVLLTVGGGVLGMLVGIGLSGLISRLMSLPFVISLESVFLAVGVSGGIGVVFGWYPAQKAASLSPIEALRYE